MASENFDPIMSELNLSTDNYKLQTLRVNISRILKIKNAKFSGNFFIRIKPYMEIFQIFISVSLNKEYIK